MVVDQGLRGNSMNYGNVGQLRSVIEKYAKVGGKFPEYCDIGLGVFYDVYDWHVRHQQQIQIARVADQRITILFMFTQCLVRWENDLSYVGVPYEASLDAPDVNPDDLATHVDDKTSSANVRPMQPRRPAPAAARLAAGR